MSLSTNLIGELIRDANLIGHLDAYQKRLILERAVETIRDLREEIGIPRGPGQDALNDLHTTALAIERGWRDDHQVKQAMLTAATMIRDLHIVLESGTKINLRA